MDVISFPVYHLRILMNPMAPELAGLRITSPGLSPAPFPSMQIVLPLKVQAISFPDPSLLRLVSPAIISYLMPIQALLSASLRSLEKNKKITNSNNPFLASHGLSVNWGEFFLTSQSCEGQMSSCGWKGFLHGYIGHGAWAPAPTAGFKYHFLAMRTLASYLTFPHSSFLMWKLDIIKVPKS